MGVKPITFSGERKKFLETSLWLTNCFLKPCQKALVTEQDQKRSSRFSGSVVQKVHKSFSHEPILLKKTFVESLLCKSLNWKTTNFVHDFGTLEGQLVCCPPINRVFSFHIIIQKPHLLALDKENLLET